MSREKNLPATLTTTCPLDCPDACKMLVTIDDGRVTKIDGAKDDACTAGYVCGKVRNYAEHVYSRERVQTPLRRRGLKGSGQFVAITWDEAYSSIVERIKLDRDRFGAESILPLCYGGSNGKLTQDSVDARFFYRLEASRLDRTVCAAPSGAAYQSLYGKMPGVAYQDYEDSQLIVVWGNNPHASGIHLVPRIQDAQRRGAKLIVIDPRKTSLAAQADQYLPIYPGTDLAVALAMIRWLSEAGFADAEFLDAYTNGYPQLLARAQTWTVERAAKVARVSESALEALFRLYAETNPAVLRCGWGPERNRNGGSAIAAILAIPAVANKFRRSGGFTMSNSGAWRLDQSNAIQAVPPKVRRINMNLIGEALLSRDDRPVSTLFVYNCNPLVTLPEQNKVLRGLEREDLFTVVFDQVMTDTAAYADIVLPATTFLEHHDLRNGYGNTRMGDVKPVVEPIGQAKPNYEVFGELLVRLNLDQPDDLVTPAALREALLGAEANQALTEQGELTPACGPRPVQMQDVLPATPSGKIELFPTLLDSNSKAGLYQFIEESPEGEPYPLALISPSTAQTVNSSLGYLLKKQAVAALHPHDASARGIESGQSIRIFNARGEIVLPAQLDETVAPGVVLVPKGIWMRHTENGRTSNALVPDTLSDIGAGACFNDARVDVVLA